MSGEQESGLCVHVNVCLIQSIFFNFHQMVYAYKRKTDQGSWTTDAMLRAMCRVREEGLAIREAVGRYEVPGSTLQRHLKTNNPNKQLGRFRPVFSVPQELQLVEHLKKMDGSSLD